MTPQELLALYDQQQRIEVKVPGTRREAFPNLVRYVSLNGTDGMIMYSRLDETTIDAAIEEQIAYYEGIGQNFEWKVYAHDTPHDLKERLGARGFEVAIEGDEAIMVLDLDNAEALLKPVTHDIRRITDPDQMSAVLSVQAQVWNEDFTNLARRLGDHLRNEPDFLSVYVAYSDGIPVSSAWTMCPAQNQFGSLWGGSTLEAQRGKGFYTALLSVRAQEAVQRGFRFLVVDASDMSRTILAKLGFQRIATAYPCEWHVENQPNP